MKKFLLMVLTAALLCTSFALAEMPVIVDVPIEEAEISVTTGEPINHPNRTMTCQMDNEPGARPQIGIGSADIVYEIELYNGGYTRYTVVFNNEIPEKIEAIRSTRIVNVDYYKEYGGAFVHYGEQNDKGSDAGDYMADVGVDVRYDGIKGIAGFYRDKSRKAPNNVVCKLQELYDKTDWEGIEITSPLSFGIADYSSKGDAATELSVVYRADSYNPSFKFKDGKYYRYYNGNAHKDGGTGEQLAYENVIVQRVNYSWYDGASDRPKVTTTGTNTCDYFIDGVHFTGTWVRDKISENTRYFDADGNEVIFKPGKTFIEIVKEEVKLSYAG